MYQMKYFILQVYLANQVFNILYQGLYDVMILINAKMVLGSC